MRDSSLETSIREIGERLYRDALRSRPALFGARGPRGVLLDRALGDERLRTALFQFIDVLPQLEEGAAIARHFRAYLAGQRLGGVWGRLLRLGAHPVAAWAVRSSVARTARLFLVEETPAALSRALGRLRGLGALASLDAVGEAVLTEAEAERYAQRYAALLAWQEAAGVEAPQVSLKLSALTPRFDPLDTEGAVRRVLERAAPIIAQARRLRAGISIDMEHYALKPLVLAAFRALAEAHPQPDWQPGLALQAYLPETERDLAELAAWARARGRRVGVRLVKGAYWDTEVALARQRRWPVPVYLDKAATDASYERLTRALFAARDAIYPAIASHNLRSLAHAIAAARASGLGPADWEIQMLYGMAEPLARAVSAQGERLRVYVPTGDLVIGIAYLIRRLLENTASTSVLRQTYAEAEDRTVLLAEPRAIASATEASPDREGFANTPVTDFSQAAAHESFREALRRVRGTLGARYRFALPGGAPAEGGTHASANPARPEEILGEIELAAPAQVARAVENAHAAFPAWRSAGAAERAAKLLRAAGILLERRAELAAWQVLEQAKNWREADADVAEAIDHLRYYAARAVEIEGWRETRHFPGETNFVRYESRGVAAIVAPWNFPLAILSGMTGAALAAGNCAIMKPAAPAMIVAHRFHRILLEAGIAPDVCQLLPGRGASLGEALVEHPGIHLIAFTGSREVGLRIRERAARVAPGQSHLKALVCEMGGKNAVIVDEDADLDEAVPEVLHSAFGYQGQKCSACSRVVAVGSVHDRFVRRLAQALDAHPLGPPEDPQYVFGPVISREAQQKVLGYLELGRSEGRLAYLGRCPEPGFYAPPAIFTAIEPRHRLAREEIFGPVLSILRARDFEQAIEIALDSDYALTGGVFSRLPEHLALARARFRVGNLYLNRRITGARVGVQPFGGVKLSGTGVQAGGPDYLLQFMWSRVVAENTARHGFVPQCANRAGATRSNVPPAGAI